jgi:phosphatidate cytidylyltransferase
MPPARRSGTGSRPDPRRRSGPPPSRAGGGVRSCQQARAARARAREADRERGERPGRSSDLLGRILVAVPAAVVAIVFVDIGGTGFAVFMIAVGWICQYELYRLLGRWRPVPAVGYLASAAMVLAARFGTQRDVFEIALAALPLSFLAVAARGHAGMGTVSVAGTLLGVWWIGLAFAHAELLRAVPSGAGGPGHGAGVLLDILIGTFLGDTAAYVGGRLFGRTPLAPEISPKKTVEGLFCGMLIAIVAVIVAGLNQSAWLTQGDALLLGAAVAILGPLGDLFESMVKREAGAKDAGSVFGAHGGALDRLDAVIFTVVAGYYIWIAVPH